MANLNSIIELQNDYGGQKGAPLKSPARETILKYLYYLPVFLASLAICIGLTYVYLRYKSPVYGSSIDILVKDEAGAADLSKQILSELNGSGKTNIANELRKIKSATLMEKVVRANNLNVVLYSIGKVREIEIYDLARECIHFKHIRDSTLSYEVQFAVENNKIYIIKGKQKQEVANQSTVQEQNFDFVIQLNNDFNTFKPKSIYKATWYPPVKMAETLAGQIEAKALNIDASIIHLTMLSETSAKARDILNTLAAEYSKAELDEKNRTIDNTITFVNDRLLLISGELGGIENNLKNFRQQNTLIDIPAQGQQDLERLTAIRDKLDESQIKLQVTDMISDYVNNPARKYNLVPSSLGIEDITLLELIKDYNLGVLKREELLKTVAPSNIAVVTLENQLEQLQQKVLENTRNVRKTYQSAYEGANSEYSRILGSIKSIPAKQKSFLEIERQQGIKEKLYLYLMEKREEAAITRASTIASSFPLDPAKTSSGPVSPNVNSFYAVALILSLGVPIGLIFLRDFLNDKVITRADITDYSKVPIIGEVNHINGKTNKLIAGKSRSLSSEQFRVIRTNLSFFLKGEPGTVILVTSTMPNEGKTFISMNLGAILALSGKKVALLEFDLRKPKLSAYLGINKNTLGITNFLTEDIKTSDLLKPISGFDNYFLISSGPVPPNPGELILDDKINILFNELKKSFDYIIVDSPPVGIVSDAKVLSAFSYLNLYIVRQRFTFKKQLELINELYINKTFTNMSLIINDVVATGANGYYGYSKVYGYGNYHYDNSSAYGYNGKVKNTFWKKIKKRFSKSS